MIGPFARTLRMSAQTITFALLLGLCVDLGAQSQSAVTSGMPWISVVGQSPFVMPADRKTVTVPLLVTLASGLETKDVTVTLLDVRYEKLVDERVTSMFSLEPSIDRGAGRGPSILIKIADVTTLRPGEYQLTIAAEHKKRKPAVALAVTIERPGVELEPPGKLLFELHYNFSLFARAESSTYPQELRLTQAPASKFSQISEAVIHAGPFKSGGEASSQGVLELRAKTPVAAGQPLIVGVTAKNFPAGVSTGSLEVRGPDFKVPRSVEIEVRARYSTMWIPVLIMSGLVLGYLLRVVLQRRVELAKARARSLGVVEELEKRLSQTPDKVFSEQVRLAVLDLRGAVNEGDSTAIDERAKKANDALTSATTDLQNRINRTHERLKSFQAIVSKTENLPPELAGILQQALDACNRCAEQLERFDETRATRTLDALEPKLTSEVLTAVIRWRMLLPLRCREMEQLQTVLEKPDELVEAVAKLYQRIDAIAVPGDISGIAASLGQVREVQAQTAARVVWLSETVSWNVAEFDRLFVDRYGERDPALAEFGRISSELKDQLLASGKVLDPAKPIYERANRNELTGVLESLLRIVLTKHESTLQPAERTAFDAARKQQRYWNALRSLPSAVSRLKADVTLGQDQTSRPSFHAPQPPPAPADASEPVPTMTSESVATLKARTFGEVTRTEGAQAAIVAVLITGLGYVLFADRFVGTLTDLATVFLWGFTLDISVSKLLEVASPLTAKTRQS